MSISHHHHFATCPLHTITSSNMLISHTHLYIPGKGLSRFARTPLLRRFFHISCRANSGWLTPWKKHECWNQLSHACATFYPTRTDCSCVSCERFVFKPLKTSGQNAKHAPHTHNDPDQESWQSSAKPLSLTSIRASMMTTTRTWGSRATDNTTR